MKKYYLKFKLYYSEKDMQEACVDIAVKAISLTS